MRNNLTGKNRKVCTAGLALLLTSALIMLLLTGSVLATNDGQITRLFGANRWETSANVALAAYPGGSDNVIIARGDDTGGWADGLAGGYLAGVLDAPILLTAPNTLPSAVSDAIGDLGAQKAYILGGTGAVSAGVQAQLEALGLEIERISGATREATAAQIAGMGEVADNTAFIVQGRAPADSMVAGAAAFAKNYPILLVNKNDVPLVTATTIVSLGIENIIIVGGTGVVSSDVQTELTGISGVANVIRLSGANRETTSVVFAENQFANSINFSIVNGRRGLADAVGASVFGNPILYVNSIPEVVKNYLEARVTSQTHFHIFGGTAVVSNDVAVMLQEMIDDAVITIKDGIWIADSPQIGEQAVVFHVKDGRITKEGSPLTMPYENDPVSLIVRYPYGWGGFTDYVSQDILISEAGSFLLESGFPGLLGGHKIVAGTFTSSTSCTGWSYHKESSHEWKREMEYDWTAYHIDEYVDPEMDIKDGAWYGFDITNDPLMGLVNLFVKNNTITSDGSTLVNGACLELLFVYDWDAEDGWIFRFTGDLEISEDQMFIFETTVNGHAVGVAGIFLKPDDPAWPEQMLYGTAYHVEIGRDMFYNWYGFHEGDLTSAEHDLAEFEFDVSIFENREPVELDLEVEVIPIN